MGQWLSPDKEQICLVHSVQSPKLYRGCDANPLCVQYPPGLLQVAPVGLGGQGDPMQNCCLLCCAVIKPLVSDLGVLCLLPAAMKDLQVILLSCKQGKIPDSSQTLTQSEEEGEEEEEEEGEGEGEEERRRRQRGGEGGGGGGGEGVGERERVPVQHFIPGRSSIAVCPSWWHYQAWNKCQAVQPQNLSFSLSLSLSLSLSFPTRHDELCNSLRFLQWERVIVDWE